MDRLKEHHSPAEAELTLKIEDIDRSFQAYLFGGRSQDIIQPPRVIDFGWCRPALIQMMEETILMPIPDEKRQEIYQEVWEELGDLLPEEVVWEICLPQFLIKSAVERERLVYIASTEKRIKITPIRHGTHNSVKTSIPDVIREKSGIPLLHIHSHSENMLFSLKDFEGLIVNIGSVEKRLRFIRSVMVLCPDIQVLALVTNQTPLLQPEEAIAFFDDWEKRLEEEYSGMTQNVRNEQEEVDSLARQIIEANLESFVGYSKKMTERVQEGQATKRGLKDELYHFLESCGEMGEQLIQKQSVIDRIEGKARNHLLYSFVRETHLQLYSSSDLRIFKAFSA